MSDRPAKVRFLKDIENHSMEIHCDNGVHRHLTFSNNGSSVYRFHITTWPGYLAISGDMGTFVFARLHDMFSFFRGDEINLGYWSEKLTAHDKHSGHLQFSEAMFADAVRLDFEGWSFDGDEDQTKAWGAITDEWDGLLNCANNTHEAHEAAAKWECPVTGQRFTDFWEHLLEDYSYHFVWCCYAIQHAVQQYDTKRIPANDNNPSTAPAEAA